MVTRRSTHEVKGKDGAARRIAADEDSTTDATVASPARSAGRGSPDASDRVTELKSDASGDAGPASAGKGSKPLKSKLVRDSYTIPRGEYAAIAQLKKRALTMARSAKKSELLRAGLMALSAMPDQHLLSALEAVPGLKTGRPKLDNGTGEKGADSKISKRKGKSKTEANA